jgi:hypothetical protein
MRDLDGVSSSPTQLSGIAANSDERVKRSWLEVGSTYMYSKVAYVSLSRGQHWHGVAGTGLRSAERSVFVQD